MNTINLTEEVIKNYIPNILTEVEGEIPLAKKLAPYIKSAKQWLETEYLGHDDFLRDSHNDLALKIIVNKAFADAIPSLDLIITPSGMAVINTDNMAPASKERVERLVASLRDYVRANVWSLLDICFTYEDWRRSERGQYFCASFINSPKRCADLDMSFEEARRRAIVAEAELAERYLGREMMNTLRSDYCSGVLADGISLVTLIHNSLIRIISLPDSNRVFDQNRLWHTARPILNELNYHPEYKKLWESEMGDKFNTKGFVNNVKGGFFF